MLAGCVAKTRLLELGKKGVGERRKGPEEGKVLLSKELFRGRRLQSSSPFSSPSSSGRVETWSMAHSSRRRF